MNAHILQELENLGSAEKRSLGEALIVIADSEAQRTELRSRLAHHRAHPDEPGLNFAQLKARLTASA